MRKREIAKIVRVAELLKGKYVVFEEEPNGILVGREKISRCNILGAVILKEEGLLKVDDGTASIPLRVYEQYGVEVGDIIRVIGRPTESQGERFVIPEIVKKVKDKEWAEVRSLELKEREFPDAEDVEEEKPPDVLSAIQSLDKGEGVPTEEVMKNVKDKNVERIIARLLEEGEIFEVKRGILKVL